MEAIGRLVRGPDRFAELLREVVGRPIAEFAQMSPAFMEDARAKLVADIAMARKAPPPKPAWQWGISDAYSGIERAQLVVVNVRNDGERRAGEQLVADVVRLSARVPWQGPMKGRCHSEGYFGLVAFAH